MLLLAVSALAPVHAQSDYPNRPIRLVVGFAAGGGNDIFARVVSAKLFNILGRPVVVENRPGARRTVFC
jgi:tripartite-type tricarboxylate transporter receptor subunit TctC